MKQSEVIEIVGMIVAGFPTSKLDSAGVNIYRKMLVDLPAEPTRKAITRLLGTHKFTPSIAEIRAAVAEQTHGAPRTGEEAYTELMAAVDRCGRDYGQGVPKFRDPLIARCIGVWGSWNDLCNSPRDDPGGRARFVELYNDLAQRQRQDLASGIPLPAANDTPAFRLPRGRAVESTERDLKPAQQLVTALARRSSPAATPAREPRRWTPEELDEAIGGAG